MRRRLGWVALAALPALGLVSCAGNMSIIRPGGLVESHATAADSLNRAVLLGPDSATVAAGARARAAALAVADSTRADSARADSAHLAADTTHTAHRTRVETASGRAAKQAKPSAPPPLDISAANVTGSHGPTGDVVMLNGDVRITRGHTVITADNGRYDKAAGMLYLDDHVELVDSTTTVNCDHASYSEKLDILWLVGDVVVVDRDAVLRAPSGSYDRRTGRAVLNERVEAMDKKQRVSATDVVYWRDRQLLQARGHVQAEDLDNKLILRADSVDYDRVTKDATAIGHPELEARDDQGHSGFLRARRLLLNTDTRVARALDSVTVVRDTLQARADSALFDDQADRGWMLGHPRAWDGETVVTGDTLEVWSQKRQIQRFVVRRNALIDYVGRHADNLGEASKLSGNRVDVFFTKDVVDSLMAMGGARNEYQGVARAGKTPEANSTHGDSITIYFRDRKIDRARVLGNASGQFRFAVTAGDTNAAKNERVDYDAPRIEYRVPEHTIVLEPRAHLLYKELELKAGRVEFDSERQTLVAVGQPALADKGDKVTGNMMTYDIDSQSGTIYKAETEYEKGVYRGEQIRKVGDDILNVHNGSYTTCDLDDPHYHFSSHSMKIYLNDKLVAKPIVFYVKDVPLFALPFYVFPIKPGRHSGFLFPQVEFGFNTATGQFIRNLGYYWAPNDYWDATLSGDYYRDDPSWVLRFESLYKLLYRFDGDVRGSWVRDERLQHEEWNFDGNHQQELSPRTRLVAGGTFVSSRDYQRSSQYSQFLGQRLDRFLISKLAISHNADWASISAFMDRRQDLDASQTITYANGFAGITPPPIGTKALSPDLTESTPSLSVSFPTRAIGSYSALKGSPLRNALRSMYLSMDASFLRYREVTSQVIGYAPYNPDPVTTDSTTVLGKSTYDRAGAEANVSLSDSRRMFGWINLAPRISSSMAVFDHDNYGNKVVPGAVWNASISTSTTFYGTFKTHVGPLQGLRHVVYPSIGYSYSPGFPSLENRFTPFGSIALSGSRFSRMGFSLDQRLQAKVRHGDQIERLDNLISWTLSSGYDFLWRQEGLQHPLSPIGSSLRVQPPGIAAADLSWTTDVYSQRPVRNLGFNATLAVTGRLHSASSEPQLPLNGQLQYAPTDFTSPWSLGLAYSYSGGYSTPSWSSTQSVNLVASTSVSSAWRLDYLAAYDINNRLLLSQRFGVSRDLHCWFVTFSRSFIFNGEASYYLRFGIKEQRDLFYERGTRVQSLGGIQ
ncbi:MAG: putative LPS assembly protein LptD [Candidatus Eisenbacteria bacterium]